MPRKSVKTKRPVVRRTSPTPCWHPNERQKMFIRALAEFICGDQSRKSIDHQSGDSWAKEWAAVRAASPIFGYTQIDDAEEQLTQFLANTAVTVPPLAADTVDELVGTGNQEDGK